MDHILFTLSSTDGHLGCFHLLAVVTSVVDVRVQVSVWVPVFKSLRYIPMSRIAGSYANSIFILLRNCQTVFHSYHTILNSYQQCMRVPISPHPHGHLLVSVVLIVAILMGGRWYLLVVLVFISLMTRDFEQLLTCLLAICVSSLAKYLFKSFAYF